MFHGLDYTRKMEQNAGFWSQAETLTRISEIFNQPSPNSYTTEVEPISPEGSDSGYITDISSEDLILDFLQPFPQSLPELGPEIEFLFSSTPKKLQSQSKRRFSCNICHKEFMTKKGLSSHIRRHTSVYMCKLCDTPFSDRSTLVKHRRTHTGEKPYVCDICSRSFSQAGNRLRHMRNVHNTNC